MTVNIPLHTGRKWIFALACFALWSITLTGLASEKHDFSLADLPLDELLAVPIVTASKQPTEQQTTPSALYVVTEEDIRRSGARTIPDILRMVPGVESAIVNSGSHAVSIRGFNQEYANRLLVLIDGRSIRSPVIAGVIWMEQAAIMIEDIERIEVIRGPSSSVWGASAVGGVINIITKSATRTEGGLVTMGGGDRERLFGSSRYGVELGNHTHYRIWAGVFERDALDPINPNSGMQPEQENRGIYAGFRSDSVITEIDSLMISAGFFEQTAVSRETPDFSPTPPYFTVDSEDWVNIGMHVMERWERRLDDWGSFSLQSYFTHHDRNNVYLGFEDYIYEVDANLLTHFADRHSLIVGIGYRHFDGRFDSDFTLSFAEQDYDTDLYSLFTQYDIAAIKDRLHFIAGITAEHYSPVGWELQPTVRATLTPNENHTLWGGISRVVRFPSVFGAIGTRINGFQPPGTVHQNLPAFSRVLQGFDRKTEETIAYEVGYRMRPTPRSLIDLTVYFNEHDHVAAVVEQPSLLNTDPVPYITIDEKVMDSMYGESYGLELVGMWQVLRPWRLQASYAYLDINLKPRAGIPQNEVDFRNDLAPQHQATVQSYWRVTSAVDLDITLRYVDDLPEYDIDSYTECDVRIAWRPKPTMELSLVGRDLIEPHAEFGNVEVDRTLYAKLEWLF